MTDTESRATDSTKRKDACGYRQTDSAEHEGYGEALTCDRMSENNLASADTEMLEAILCPDNLNRAYKQVVRNKGAAGVDGMEVGELLDHLKKTKAELLGKLKTGKYKPAPVLRVEIPKDNGKKRMLGIPTVTDRVIQQGIAQVLTPIYEPQFVDTSYGFRPGRSAHDAIYKCLEYLDEGYVWAVDMDLEKFFDTVNQSKLVQVLSETIKDGRVISLIHKYMRAGAVRNGTYEPTPLGIPQGGPLSPLLANIMLNELDHELERRGHKFVRYADDMVIFCKSKAAAKQTLEHIIPYIEEKLFLKVNREKTEVVHASKIKFLGYSFYPAKDGYHPRVHPKSKAKMKARVKELTSRSCVRSYEGWKESLKRFIVGWVNYYKLADMGKWLQGIDEWMRRRIRMVFWKKWKRVRTRWRNLEKLGIGHEEAGMLACSRKAYWRIADTPQLHRALGNKRLEKDGFVWFYPIYKSVRA
ncbi:MAG: group II intron reverse transcriptase/maturase [Eggerthellaceae bacterium]|nr:group II intron reverse transcriptase/maturase [Eggerthellaceae bacterium]